MKRPVVTPIRLSAPEPEVEVAVLIVHRIRVSEPFRGLGVRYYSVDRLKRINRVLNR